MDNLHHRFPATHRKSMQPQEWRQLVQCSCQPSVPHVVLPFIPEWTPDQEISLLSGRNQASGGADMSKKPMSSKPDSFCRSCSHSLPRTGLLGALHSWQGRIESYQAGKMETIAIAGKLSGYIRNIWYTCMIRFLTSAWAWWQVVESPYLPITHCQPTLTPSLSNLFKKVGNWGRESHIPLWILGYIPPVASAGVTRVHSFSQLWKNWKRWSREKN